MSCRVLMVQGTSSDAGKSIVATALCRILARRGVKVAPFKPQNMALNSAVTIDGGEIGRAQALQAQAAGVAPHTDMNPVLLKPNSDIGSQVIIHGHAIGSMDARSYHAYKATAMAAVLASFARLQQRYEVIIVEGAGSPAEINLRQGDIANMGFAEAVDCEVVLVADIERGGVFAQLAGTLELLSDSERGRIKGLVINRFRGDVTLLESGIEWLQQRYAIPVLGVIPYLHGLHLEAEDSLGRRGGGAECEQPLRVVIPSLPRLSNHTDFDPLRIHPQVELIYAQPSQPIPAADLVILPGSKSVAADLAWLRAQGWEGYLQHHLRYGGRLLGICGGYQMLGESIDDPMGVEGLAGITAGLGYLMLQTTLFAQKQLTNVHATLTLNGAQCRGYEIHAGITTGPAVTTPMVLLEGGGQDGACSADGLIMGCYLHGLLDHPEALASILAWAGLHEAKPLDLNAEREQAIERLADTVEQAVAWQGVLGGAIG